MLRFLLIFILVVLMLNLVGRIFFRWLVKRQVRNFEKRASSNSQGNVGDAYVTNIPQKKKNIPKHVGEYIDFEEMN